MFSKMTCRSLILLLLATATTAIPGSSDSRHPATTSAAPPIIDRQAVVRRHNVVISASTSTSLDTRDIFTLGNGAFAFNVDSSGLQTFNATYAQPFALNTLSDWGFHTIPYSHTEEGKSDTYAYDQYNFTYLSTPIDGSGETRQVPYYIVTNISQPQVVPWLHNNPHRLHLGQITSRYVAVSATSTASTTASTAPIDLTKVSNIAQTLDLWTANVNTSWTVNDPTYAPACNVQIQTTVHPVIDLVSTLVSYSSSSSASSAFYASSTASTPTTTTTTTTNGCGPQGMAVRIAFPYGTDDDYANAADWSGASQIYHTTNVVSATPTSVNFLRILDADSYEVHCRWNDSSFTIVQTPGGIPHVYDLIPSSSLNQQETVAIELSCLFNPVNVVFPVGAWMPWMQARAAATSDVISTGLLPLYSETFAATAAMWSQFWLTSAFVDLSSFSNNNPQAFELERRIILSLYLTRANSAGSTSPQETGLLCNSWAGKEHFEMRFWHLVHWPLWAHTDLLRRSDGFLFDILPNATSYATFQGYEGARFPKMVGGIANRTSEGIDVKWPGTDYSPFPFNNGDDSEYGYLVVMDQGSPVGPLLLWEQPHVIWMADLQRKALNATNGTAAALDAVNFLSPLVFATADFLASYVYLNASANSGKGEYWMGPPMYGGEESGNALEIVNPTFELVQTALVLDIASEWRDVLNMPPKPKWIDVSSRIATLFLDPGSPSETPTYSFNAKCACAYAQKGCPASRYNLTQCPVASSHPMPLGILGMVNGRYNGDKYGVSTATANNTITAIIDVWEWANSWGWDVGMTATAQIRLGWSSTSIIETLLLNSTKNLYLKNGYNFQNEGLAAYLPGNGALLQAVAALAKGIESENGQAAWPAIGFPSEWGALVENFPIAYP